MIASHLCANDRVGFRVQMFMGGQSTALPRRIFKLPEAEKSFEDETKAKSTPPPSPLLWPFCVLAVQCAWRVDGSSDESLSSAVLCRAMQAVSLSKLITFLRTPLNSQCRRGLFFRPKLKLERHRMASCTHYGTGAHGTHSAHPHACKPTRTTDAQGMRRCTPWLLSRFAFAS